MYNLLQTCKELKNAIPLNNAPNIERITEFKDPGDLRGKVEYEHKKWVDVHLPQESKQYNLIFCGGYAIDNLTGLNFLKVLCKILNDDQYQPGNFLYLSLNAKPIAALIFVLHNALSITTKIVDQHWKGMFTKLFDDTEIQKQRNVEERNQFYIESDITDYRENAKPEYHNFFVQTCSEFLNNKVTESFKWALWNSFFGVLVAVANKMSTRGKLSVRRSPSSIIDHIPYLACIKFAFDKNESGKVSELLGEVRKEVTEPRKRKRRTLEEQEHQRADNMESTAKHLIKK